MTHTGKFQPNHKILVVDDNPAIHEDFRKIFDDEGPATSELEADEELLFEEKPVPRTVFEIESAYQGQEALSLVERSIAEATPYAMVFMDIRMPPGWDGVETTAKLWAVDPNLEVVICTAYSDYSWGEIRKRLGQSENLLILKKPFDNIEAIQLAHTLTKKWLASRQASAKMSDLEYMVARRTEELEKARDAFRTIFEAGPIAITLADADGKFVAINRAAEISFGLSQERVIGRSAFDLGWADMQTMDSIGKDLASFGAVDAYEVFHPDTGRGPRIGLLWLRAVMIDHSPHTLGFYLDITDRKKMEDELRQANVAAHEAARAKSQFLANMSHEIRTPLNAVLGFSSLLQDDDLNEDVLAKLRLIRTSGETLSKILDDILDFSKIDCGRLELEQAPFSLYQCLEWSADLFRPQAAKKHVNLALNIASGLPDRLLGDATRVRQVLTNLISNATKFTEEGSIHVDAGLSEPLTEGGHCRVRIRVSDSGIGIPADKIDRLFRSFSQIDASTTRRFGGSGLGLVISKRLVELMGGEIRVESKPGQGSTFEFEFEAGLAPEEAASPQRGPETMLQSLKILVAEDNPVNRKVADAMLRRFGCVADFVIDGEEAIRRVAESSYDVVLMDLHMPIVDGLEASRRIRALGAPASDVSIVALTASASSEDRDACLEAGMDEYVSKPLRLEALREVLGRCQAASGLRNLDRAVRPRKPAPVEHASRI